MSDELQRYRQTKRREDLQRCTSMSTDRSHEFVQMLVFHMSSSCCIESLYWSGQITTICKPDRRILKSLPFISIISCEVAVSSLYFAQSAMMLGGVDAIFFCTDFSASNSSNSCKVSLRNCILPLEGTMSFHELSMLARTCRTPWSVDYLSPPAAFHLHRLRTPPPTSPQLFISAFSRKRFGRSFRMFLFGKDWLHLLLHSAVNNPDSLQWYADNLCIQCLPWSWYMVHGAPTIRDFWVSSRIIPCGSPWFTRRAFKNLEVFQGARRSVCSLQTSRWSHSKMSSLDLHQGQNTRDLATEFLTAELYKYIIL